MKFGQWWAALLSKVTVVPNPQTSKDKVFVEVCDPTRAVMELVLSFSVESIGSEKFVQATICLVYEDSAVAKWSSIDLNETNEMGVAFYQISHKATFEQRESRYNSIQYYKKHFA